MVTKKVVVKKNPVGNVTFKFPTSGREAIVEAIGKLEDIKELGLLDGLQASSFVYSCEDKIISELETPLSKFAGKAVTVFPNPTGGADVLSLEQFLERVKKGESVSRFDFSLSFKWDSNAVSALVKVVADLRSANLRSANLSYANLSSANLSSADLSYANLSSANLRSADLRSANLSYANLSSANLRSADLRSANLRSADFMSASFSLACGLSWATLLSSMKNVSKKQEQYLFLQAISHLSWEQSKDGVNPIDYVRGWLGVPTIPSKVVKMKAVKK